MAILEVHLVEGMHTPSQHAELLATMSTRGAEVLGAPLERVRAYVTVHRREHWAAGGRPGAEAPYFTATVPEGGPPEQRRQLLGALTDILVDVLGAERAQIQGHIVQIPANDWVGPAARSRSAVPTPL